MKITGSGFGIILGVSLALAAFNFLPQTALAEGETISSEAKDLCGKWKIESAYSGGGPYGGGQSRFFEFFPEGNLVETRTYNTSRGETTESYKKSWKVLGNKVVIAGAGEYPQNGQSITIEIPFNLSKLQIVETWETPTSTRTTKMQAIRDGAFTPEQTSPLSKTVTPGQNPLPKIALTVVPSVKNARVEYFKTQRISLGISLVNPNLIHKCGTCI